MKCKQVLFAILALLWLCEASQAQLVVDDGVIPQEAVETHLAGDGLQTANITFLGDNNQLGSFDATMSNIGLANGIILATGAAAGAIGPNNTTSQTQGGGNLEVSDPDLELISGATMHDACVLEFDFVAESDSLIFNYVFASEEYNEYVCSDFNDVFGFFLSGPGISGPFQNNAINLAVLPDTDIPVAVNSVNNGSSGIFGTDSLCSMLNENWEQYTEYHFDNSISTGSNETQYDGFTVGLTAKSGLICGETYHIKLAIADAEDDNLDSAVFLESGSLDGSGFDIEFVVDNAPSGHPTDCMIESCVGGTLRFSRTNVETDATVNINTFGAADMGIDYSEIPSTISFAAGEENVELQIEALWDEITEGEEELVVSIEYTNICGQLTTVSTTVLILDYALPLSGEDSTFNLCPGEAMTILAEVENGLAPFEYSWDGELGADSLIVDTEAETLLEVTDYCGNSAVTIYTLTNPDELITYAPEETCLEAPVEIVINGGVEPYQIEWDTETEHLGESLYWIQYEGLATVIITDGCGMLQELEIAASDCSIIVPNVFSPNDDGQNDYFRIDGLESPLTASLTVHNRWGGLVFQTNHYLNNWDAYGVEEGVYYYVLQFSDGTKSSGSVTVMR